MSDNSDKIINHALGVIEAFRPDVLWHCRTGAIKNSDLKALAADYRRLRELVGAVVSLRGSNWRIYYSPKQTPIDPAAGLFDIEEGFYVEHEDWEGGREGPFDSPFAAFQALEEKVG